MDNMSCTIIVPAAGDSTRYKTLTEAPKGVLPFTWRGKTKTMIEHCVPENWDEKIYVVCKSTDTQLFAAMLPSNYNILELQLSIGQANSALYAINAFMEGDLLIINSDNGFDCDLRLFVKECRSQEVAAGAVVFKATETCFGYVSNVPFFGWAKEKEAISDYALAGAFYFRDVNTYIDAYAKTLDKIGDSMVGVSISALFAQIPGPKYSYIIPRNQLHVWGTADDLLNDETVKL